MFNSFVYKKIITSKRGKGCKPVQQREVIRSIYKTSKEKQK